MADASVTAIDGRAVVRVGGSELLDAYVGQAIVAADGAAASQSASELAAATALAASRYYATRAAGEAASATGQLFSTDDGAGNVIYYRRTTGGSVEIGRAVTPAALAAVGGSSLVGFDGRSVYDKLRDTVSVKDARFAGGAKGDSSTDDTAAIQAAIDSLQATGGTVLLPLGIYRTTASLIMRSGVSIQGSGRYYNFTTLNVFTGSWIQYRGSASSPALTFFNIAHVNVSDLGVDCGEVAGSVGIYLGSSNAPATKLLNFQRIGVFGCTTAVKWGNESLLAPLEQVDDISFREINCNSCINGFVVNAANAADFSIIERASFYSCSGTAIKLITPGFMRISECAAGSLVPGFIMFDIAGLSPDPVVISGCQSEGVHGMFLRYTATNDQSQIELRGNVINQPVELSGLIRVTSRNNFINTTVKTNGFVRWRSDDDVWDGLLNQPLHIPQITIGDGGQFFARAMRNAGSYFGYYLPVGFRIENGDPVAGGFEGVVVVQKGIRTTPFVPNGAFPVGSYVNPSAGNGHAYIVTTGGVAGAEPAWNTASGTTTTSGAVVFKEVGPSIILRGYGAIQA